jgi:cytoskeletal protein RodZ
MKQNKQAGFGAVEGLIVLVVVLLIGFAGWYMVTKHKDNKPKATNTTSTSASKNDQKTSNATTGDTKYLEIKEWGIKFALTTDTADAYYDNKTASPLASMSLRSHALDSEPDCTTAPQSIASIFRVPKDAEDDSLPGKKYNETQDGKTIGDYFYFIQSSQISCTQNLDKQIILQGIRNSFNTASPTIQKI